MKRLRLNKDNIWLVAALIVIIMTAIPTIIWMQRSNKDRAQRHNSQVSPVIMGLDLVQLLNVLMNWLTY